MNAFPFRADEKLTDVLKRTAFALSAEVIPPRNGAEQVQVLGQIQSLVQAGAQFLAVTKGAGGSLRGGSLPIAQAIKESFKVPCIAHFTCRDLNAQEVENSLVDHHYFGIRNILALRGDPPDGQPEWKARAGGYDYAFQLIEQIRRMNQGEYLVRPGGPEARAETDKDRTDFCIGAACYPEYPVEKDRVGFFKIKAQAGAQFGISDMLFDAEAYARFLDLCRRHGVEIPVLPGTRLLRTRPQAERMAAKFKVSIPAATLDKLPMENGPEALDRGLELLLKLAERLRGLGAPGLHLYVIADTAGAGEALRRLSENS